MDENIARQHRAMMRLEAKYIPRIVELKQTLLDNLAFIDIYQPILAREFSDLLQAIYNEAIPQVGAIVQQGLVSRRKTTHKTSASFWINLAQQWLFSEGLTRASLIAQTTIEDAQMVLADSISAGTATIPTANQLQVLLGINKQRAKVIALTEVHNASMFASLRTAEQYADETGLVMLKKWDATLDSRTRPDHSEADRLEPIPLNEKFRVGGREMDRPGDPAGGGSQTIRCRCVLNYLDNFDTLD